MSSETDELINRNKRAIANLLFNTAIFCDADEEGSWVTINGVHILIKGGESAAQAFERTTGKKLGGGGTETPISGSAVGSGGEQPNMNPAETKINAIHAEWKAENATPPTDIGNGVVTLSWSEFSAKYPDAVITRQGKFGLEAEVTYTNSHGTKTTDLFTAYASRKR